MTSKTLKLLESANSDDKSSVSFAKRQFPAFKEAQKAFSQYKKKILKPKEWNQNSGMTGFELFDKNGEEIEDRNITKNNLFRLSLKGSGKYDWVKIIEISESETEIVISVKPTHDPTDKDSDKAATSHFFVAESRNNFCLLLESAMVSFYVIGLRETSNTDETKNMLETVRNVITANLGSYLGIQKSEWTTFCKNFLDSYQPSDAS